MKSVSTVFRLLIVAAITSCAINTPAAEPVMLWQDTTETRDGKEVRRLRSCAILRKLDGSFAFYDRFHPEAGPLELPDSDGNLHVLSPYLPTPILSDQQIHDSGILKNTQVLQTGDSEITSVFVRGEKLDREAAKKIGLPRYLNVWMQQASPATATDAKMIWQGYNGSQIEYERMPDGRLLVPFGSFQPHGRLTPPHGRHKTVIQYSDDNGATWTESESRLVSPCYPGFNGNNEGACEPAIERLRDGRIWMLMRTQAGFLYESLSVDNGTTWQPARASRFYTSTGPPCILRLQDGRLIVCWNNCEMPPRANGDGVYGGRDALHIAISDDDGHTWQGFREIYLDHRRNDNPAKSGDRGTAYPLAAFTDDGRIAVMSGQGKGGRNVILVDPDWITATEASSDFSDGLHDWSHYTHHGPAKGWWRARAIGCRLTASPTNATSQCLHVRHASELPADGAVWNFPNGWSGSLTTRIMLKKGSQGGSIALNDRMFDPSNSLGEQLAVFRLDIDADGNAGSVRLQPGQWHTVTFRWNLTQQECRLLVDDRPAGTLPLLQPTLNGLSYLRFRASTEQQDPIGMLVEEVHAAIRETKAPPVTPNQQREQEQRYVNTVVPTWQN